MAFAKVIQIIQYFFKYQKGKVTTLIVYVDDMIITREIAKFQKQLATEFKMENL
jgi:ABC-type lipoprotein release transport system permease subunit